MHLYFKLITQRVTLLMFSMFRTHNRTGDSAFKVTAPQLRNSFNHDLVNAASSGKFKPVLHTCVQVNHVKETFQIKRKSTSEASGVRVNFEVHITLLRQYR